jgi:hypothetical protein
MDENHPCPTCIFYRDKPKNTSGSALVGYCHRYPRVYFNGYYNIIEVKNVDWCGEWIANEEYIKSHIGEI